MATATWPLTLPQEPDPGSWTWQAQDNKVSFKPAIGPPIERRRGTAIVRSYDATFSYLTGAQVAIFEAFFDDDLKSGTLHYLWLEPMSGILFKWKISQYQFLGIGADLYKLTMKLLRLPGAAV